MVKNANMTVATLLKPIVKATYQSFELMMSLRVKIVTPTMMHKRTA